MKVEVIDRKGRVIKVRPESEEDLWLLRITLRRGDHVVMRTTRDVQVGSGKKERVSMTLKIKLDLVEFQPFTGKLRISGIVVEGPDEFGVKGRRHSTSISIGQQIVVERDSGWSRSVLDRLSSGSRRGTTVMAAIDYDEVAVAAIAGHGMKILYDRSSRLPGKDDPARDQELEKYVEDTARRIVEAASKYSAKVAVIVGPGSLKDGVASRVRSMAPGLRVIVSDASMGGLAGIREGLRRESITRALRELSVIEAEEVIEEFLRRVARSGDDVAYTPREVLTAARLGAVDVAVLLDNLLYELDDEVREAVDESLVLIENRGGRIVIVPEDTPAGEKIRSFGGIIALLRYKLPRESRMQLE